MVVTFWQIRLLINYIWNLQFIHQPTNVVYSYKVIKCVELLGARSAKFSIAAWLVHWIRCKKNHCFCVLGQRDIATADDEDHVCSILETLMKGNGYNWGWLSRLLDHGHAQLSLAFFINIDCSKIEWWSKHSDGNLAIVKGIVYHRKSWLYTLVCPAGPWYDKSANTSRLLYKLCKCNYWKYVKFIWL